MDKRSFLKRTALLGAGTVIMPGIVKASLNDSQEGKAGIVSGIPKDAVILFQGDSITDAGRNKEGENTPNDRGKLGNGYAFLAATGMLARYPEKNLQIYNKGISGNKVYQLQERWQQDCIDIKPDILSILIGVNDFWHMKDGNYDGDVARYNTDYRKLLDNTKTNLPDVKIVICEPFLLTGGRVVKENWENEFEAYRNAARQIAEDYKAVFVPFQQVLKEALKKAPAGYWGGDGVHPSLAGAQLMANAWMEAVG